MGKQFEEGFKKHLAWHVANKDKRSFTVSAVEPPKAMTCAWSGSWAYSVLLNMPRKKKGRPYARIAITLPPEVLAAADRIAAQMDRSRSWVVAEAVRRYAVTPGNESDVIAAGRLQLLQSDLARSPAERLRRAEELTQLARIVHPRKPRTQIIAFDSADEFMEWKRSTRIRV